MPEIDLRGGPLSSGFPREEQFISRELYYLLAIFSASPKLAQLRQSLEGGCVYGWSIRSFEYPEVGRILLGIASMVRNDWDADPGRIESILSMLHPNDGVGVLVPISRDRRTSSPSRFENPSTRSFMPRRSTLIGAKVRQSTTATSTREYFCTVTSPALCGKPRLRSTHGQRRCTRLCSEAGAIQRANAFTRRGAGVRLRLTHPHIPLLDGRKSAPQQTVAADGSLELRLSGPQLNGKWLGGRRASCSRAQEREGSHRGS